MSAFIDMHRDLFGVEPICTTLDVSASAYYQRATGEVSARTLEDQWLTAKEEPSPGSQGEGHGRGEDPGLQPRGAAIAVLPASNLPA